MPKTTTSLTRSEQYYDALIRHQVFLLRFSGILRKKIYDILNETEDRIANRIRRETFAAEQDRRLERAAILYAALKTIREKAWEEASEEWLEQFIRLALDEPRFTRAALGGTHWRSPTKYDLLRVVRKLPQLGKTIPEWIRGEREADLQRMRSAILFGVAQGEDSGTVARRVVGSARSNGADGATETTRRNLDTLLVTLALGTAGGARDVFLSVNSDVLEATRELWVSVLDHRTTPICRSLDGKIFRVGEGPHPPLHFRCRSTRSLLFPGDKPPRPSYQEWLARQSQDFQDSVLGKTRGKLFREGGMKLTDFVDRRGWDNMPLRELARLERQAFIDAGLNPEDYFQ